jgi:uncharacterized membrane protein YfcA
VISGAILGVLMSLSTVGALGVAALVLLYPGILAGSWLTRRVPAFALRPALATVLLLVGANLVHVKLF